MIMRLFKRTETEFLPAKEAYIASVPAMKMDVMDKISQAIKDGRNKAYWDGDAAKLPVEIVKQLVEKGYSLEVAYYDFKDYPSVTIFFNKNATGELIKVDDDITNRKVTPLTYEEYEKIGRRN